MFVPCAWYAALSLIFCVNFILVFLLFAFLVDRLIITVNIYIIVIAAPILLESRTRACPFFWI